MQDSVQKAIRSSIQVHQVQEFTKSSPIIWQTHPPNLLLQMATAFNSIRDHILSKLWWCISKHFWTSKYSFFYKSICISIALIIYVYNIFEIIVLEYLIFVGNLFSIYWNWKKLHSAIQYFFKAQKIGKWDNSFLLVKKIGYF